MTERPLSPELRALLDQERAVPPLSAAQHARAMNRARASLVAPAAPAVAAHRPAARRWLVAAAAASAASAAIGAAAYEIHARFASTMTPAPTPVAGTVARPLPARQAPAAATVDEAPAPAPEPAVAAPTMSPADAVRVELRLLREARAAVARKDFAGALVPLGEHARRFRTGRLVEEREALRVKALAGLGRTEEARRAAAAFRARFPRSVLLPAVSQMPAAAP
jgi:hypothetical protein